MLADAALLDLRLGSWQAAPLSDHPRCAHAAVALAPSGRPQRVACCLPAAASLQHCELCVLQMLLLRVCSRGAATMESRPAATLCC